MQSLFIILGVAIGVGVIVFMSALLAGLQANLFRRVLSSQPHITLERPKQQATPVLLAAPGQQIVTTIQKPSQRVNTIDQWQNPRSGRGSQRRCDRLTNHNRTHWWCEAAPRNQCQ
jgi:lipoprotein-releasing system permease protein